MFTLKLKMKKTCCLFNNFNNTIKALRNNCKEIMTATLNSAMIAAIKLSMRRTKKLTTYSKSCYKARGVPSN